MVKYLLTILIALIAFSGPVESYAQWVSPIVNDDPNPNKKIADYKDNDDEERSMAFGHIGLDDDRLRDIAENVFNLTKAMSNKYTFSDGLTITGYVARYMAEIGEYELVSKDLLALVKAFANLREQPITPEVMKILGQIQKLKFGKKNGKLFMRFYSKLRDGINIEINEKIADPKSSLKEIYYIRIEDGAEVTFEDVFEAKDKKKMIRYIQTKGKIGLISKDSVSQIHKGIIKEVPNFYDKEYPALPLKMKFDKMFVHVNTSSIFKDIKFNFNTGYLLPGIRNISGPLPSFVLGMKKGIIHLKTSIDR